MGTLSDELDKRPISVDEYHQMIEHGVLVPQDRVELIGGSPVSMPAMGANRANEIEGLNDRGINDSCALAACVRAEENVILPIMVVRP